MGMNMKIIMWNVSLNVMKSKEVCIIRIKVSYINFFLWDIL